MTRKKLRLIFNEVKKSAKLDFALTRGTCCQSCTWESIATKYGDESHGIWLKWFPYGMNGSEWENCGIYYIAHDLTEEQKKLVYNALSKHFDVEWNLTDGDCIKVYFE